MAYLSQQEVEELGFKEIGINVKISKNASIYGAHNISIGDNVRIDDFCVLSAGNGGIIIGAYIHIGVYSSLIGAGLIHLNDFCNISSKVAIYSSNDDYSGEYMTNPQISSEYKNVEIGPVIIGRHVIIGSGSIILPNSTMEDGSALGALSMLQGNILKSEIYAGVPAKFIKMRSNKLFEIENKFNM